MTFVMHELNSDIGIHLDRRLCSVLEHLIAMIFFSRLITKFGD